MKKRIVEDRGPLTDEEIDRIRDILLGALARKRAIVQGQPSNDVAKVSDKTAA